jgi:hypothetical protein
VSDAYATAPANVIPDITQEILLLNIYVNSNLKTI